MIGKTVSHYRIVGSLGAGGMGVVYEGVDVRLERPVALKFVPEELAKDRQIVERLNSEAKTASGLNHPNICTIYDIGTYDGQPFIVMERLIGQTLRERLEAGHLKVRDVIELGIQVADALDAAHHRSIIHRDIKPANLFMVDRGQVKILDFGLAKLVTRATDPLVTAGMTRDQTAEGVTLGTVAYMSPEQVTGETLDGRTDLFSLGVVLYEALTGHQPFKGKTSAVIFSEILTHAPVAPVTLNPEVPPRLQEVINNCLEKDRTLRYQNAADLVADLRRVRRDMESGQSGVFRTTTATSVTAAAPQAERLPSAASATAARRANGVVLGIAAVATAAIISGTIWLVTRPESALTPATDAKPPSPRARVALATASFEAKDYRAAMRYAEEALNLAPGDGDAVRIQEAARSMIERFDAAVAQVGQRLAAGDVEGATASLNTARGIDPAAPILSELSSRIAALPKTSEKTTPAPTAQARADARGRSTNTASVAPAPSAPATTQLPDVNAPRSSAPDAPSAPPVTTTPPVSPRPVPALTPAPSPVTPRSETTERTEPADPRTAESDDSAIRAVIAAYARAIETKDLALYRRVKPNLSADEQRRVEEGFRAVTSQRVAITVVSIEQRGLDATVRLRRRDTIQAGGRQQTSESVQTMTLNRSATGWTIREIGR
jgi:hypothetical protein